MLQGIYRPEGLSMAEESARNWNKAFTLDLPTVVRLHDEAGPRGNTSKAVLRLADGLEIECVRIPMPPDGATLCISSQVGCKMGCTFCETGRMGLLRNLSASEIISQVVVARSVLGWKIKNIVYMGMGEALDNVEAVIQSLRVFNDTRGFNIGQQRMTVCTVGHKAGIERLAQLGWPRLNLALSLNAGFDTTRSSLMPVNKKTPIRELVDAVLAYWPRKNFVLAVNYCLMPGINDGREEASQVAKFCADVGGRALINLIPYNPGNVPMTTAPTEADVARFIAWLEEDGAMVRRRKTKGRDVMGACGQLGNVALRSRRVRLD